MNNLVVSTSLSQDFDERFGFTEAKVRALAEYLGHRGRLEELREWYDGYRFGSVDIYNPWSVINYFAQRCEPDIYWGNTSGNAIIGDIVNQSGQETLEQVFALLEPRGSIVAPLDLSVIFPDASVRHGVLWSMLYLAGYLTTDDTARPNDASLLRHLRIPNKEIAYLYRTEVVNRFALRLGGRSRTLALQDAFVRGDVELVERELSRIACDSASSFDLTGEQACHMLLLGLLYGTPGYQDPRSNREVGFRRCDIMLEPSDVDASTAGVRDVRPRLTIEVKFRRDASFEADGAELRDLARAGVRQIVEQAYDASDLPAGANGRLRWGVAFAGKRVAAVCERA